MAIVLVHVWLFTGGFGGFDATLPNRALVRLDGLVAIFFLLSAFLLYRPMIARRAGGPPKPPVTGYAQARFLRIYPAYWVALTALAIVPGLFGVFSDKWWTFYSLGYYLDPLFAGSDCPSDEGPACGLAQTWTLTVEVTFYAILPLYALLTARLARGRDVRSWMRAELLLLAALAALSMFLNGPPLSLRDELWFKFTFASHFYWMALGLALAVLSVGYWRTQALPRPLQLAASRPGACWAVAGAIYVGTMFFFLPVPFSIAPYTDPEYLALNVAQGVGAALLLIPVVFGNPNRGVAARVLTNPVVAWLGLVSYGLFLWHFTIAYYLGYGGADAGFAPVAVLTFALAIPLAAASYYLIEAPLMRLKYRRLRDALQRRPRGPASGEAL